MGVFTLSNLFNQIEMNGLGESFLLPTILNMTLTASVVILFVLAARLALKKAPKVFSYALWAVVLFRLLCPVSITTDFSLLGLFDTPAVENTQHTTAVEYIPYDIVHTQDLEVQLPVPPAINEAVNEVLPQEHAALGADPLEGEFAIGSMIWLLGIGSMVIYGTVSYILLRRKLIGAVLLRDNIYLADGIGSPFVMGIIRPKIYLPSALSEQEQEYIILHEQHHIRRGDHIIKALAFIALCIHWFNPLVWVAFVMSSKDMEMSCDEAVVKKLGVGIRADYSASLLSLATGRRIIAGTPLAFGEGDTKSRIKNMLNWKKPKAWIIVVAAVICLAVVAACASNPAAMSTQPNAPTVDENYSTSDQGGSSEEQEDHNNITDSSSVVAPELAKDAVYYLELAAGETFRDMNPQKQAEILADYKELLDDYTLIARETEDGKTTYIVGQYTGSGNEAPLHGMYGIEISLGAEDMWQILYREEDSEAVETALVEQEMPTVGYQIAKSYIRYTTDGTLILIQPKDTEIWLDVAWNRYMHTPNGREYIVDAVARGIDVCGKTDTFLYVYLISERFGEIAERIALTEEEAAAILAEERVSIIDGLGFSASLNIDGQSVYYNEHSGIPQTVLDLAVERCDYRFGDPGMITDTVCEARLDCDWLDAPLYAKEEDLPRLREILKNAQFGYVGACGYAAKLTLTFTGGEKLTMFKGCDGCDSIVFGSYSGYFLGDEENVGFWEIFGLDAETKLPLDSLAQEETKTFDYEGLSLQVTNVLSTRTESMLAEGIEPHEYTVYTCAPGAVITVLNAGMADGEFYEDGQPHPQWGLSYTKEAERTRITGDTTSIPVTPELEGVYNLEASLFVLKFEYTD